MLCALSLRSICRRLLKLICCLAKHFRTITWIQLENTTALLQNTCNPKQLFFWLFAQRLLSKNRKILLLDVHQWCKHTSMELGKNGIMHLHKSPGKWKSESWIRLKSWFSIQKMSFYSESVLYNIHLYRIKFEFIFT